MNAIVSIKSELSQESEYQSECFDKEVNEKLKNKNLVYGVTQKALQKLVDMRGEKQYNEANKEWLLTPITLAEGGLRKCGYFMQ